MLARTFMASLLKRSKLTPSPMPEGVHKFETALQELDETDYWLELLLRSGAAGPQMIAALREETNELLAIFTSIVLKIKRRIGRK